MTSASLCACNVNASLRLHSAAKWVPILQGHEDTKLSNLLRMFRPKIMVSSSWVEMSKKNAGGRCIRECAGIT